MPFLVVVYASTPDQAKHIRDRYEHGDAGRVVGLYRMGKVNEPTCPGQSRCGQTGWTRHQQYGHMIHTCGKRNKRWRSFVANTLMDLFGINLLPRNATPRVFQNPEGWGR